MMNIPLLYWASEETNNIAYKQIAMRHADKTIENHIRADGSVYHVLNYDINTGGFLGPAPFTQGYDAEMSSWSRGQSWAIYGFVLSYIHTGEKRYLNAAKRVAHYFISAVCSTGYVPLSDFRAPLTEPLQLDASAGAIAACGLIETAKAVPEFEKEMYMRAALDILRALSEKHCDFSENKDSILQNSTGSYGKEKEINRDYIFGDYFFVEAMYKLKGFDILFW